MRRYTRSVKVACLTTVMAVVLSLAVAADPPTADQTAEEIQQAIEAAGAEWTAGVTWVSRLPAEEQRALCGDLDEEVPDAMKQSLPAPKGVLPTHFDWRDNGGDWTTPIRDQGSCGSCWDFAATAVFEALVNIDAANPALDMDLSEQYVLSCCTYCGSCGGGSSNQALEFYCTTGGVTEPCLPYQADDTVSCDTACVEPHVYLGDWAYIVEDVESIKSAIYYYGPICASFEVYDDFFDYFGGIYEHVWGGYAGGHAISIVGWDDTEQYWICKNSWGTDWGETADGNPCTPGAGDGGWFRILWGQCDIEGRRTVAATMTTWPAGVVDVAVLDGAGVGVPDAEIYVDGDYYGDTAPDGTLALDLIEGMYYSVAAYSYGEFLLNDSVAAPGSLTLDCRAASHVTASTAKRDGSPLDAYLNCELDEYYFTPGTTSSGTGSFYITPGAYDFQVRSRYVETERYCLAVCDVDLTSSTAMTADASSMPLAEWRLDTLLDSSAGPYTYLQVAWPAGFRWGWWISRVPGESIFYNAGDWSIDYTLRESATSAWDYRGEYGWLTFVGGEVYPIEAGGNLTHLTTPGALSYMPGDTAEIVVDLSDAFGNSFYGVYRYDSTGVQPPSTGAKPYEVVNQDGLPGDSGAWDYYSPWLTVTPPTDPAIFDGEVDLEDWNDVTIDPAAELGTYTVRSTIDTHLGELEGLSSFEVAEPMSSKEWTIMVYLAADNNLGGGTPSDPDFMDFDEMETALVSSGAALNVVVLWDKPGTNDTYIYWVQPDGTEGSLATYTLGVNMWVPPGGPEENMGAQSTLTDFLDWVFARFDSDNYGLILWNHGGGWAPKSKTFGEPVSIPPSYISIDGQLTDFELPGNDALRPLLSVEKPQESDSPRSDRQEPFFDTGICWDDTDADYLTTKEAAYGIDDSTRGRVDNLGLDACLMQMLEVAYEFYDTPNVAADYLTASEASEWGYGWAYHQILSTITSSTTPQQLAVLWGSTRSARHASGGLDTISSVDLWEIDDLAADVSALADRLTTLLATSDYEVIMYAKLLAEWFLFTDSSFIDLGDFCYWLDVFLGDATAKGLAQAVMTQLSVTVIAMSNGPPTSPWGTANGVSIYLPHRHDIYWSDYYGGPVLADYNGTNLAFCTNETWDEFVHAWLAADHPDPYESNDAPATAYDRGTADGGNMTYLCREADFDDATEDWYRMTIPFWFDLDVWVWCTEYWSNTVLYAYDSLANAQADSYFASNDDGMRTLGHETYGSRIQAAGLRPGTYYFKVVPSGGYYGTEGDYEIWIKTMRGGDGPAVFRVDSDGYMYMDGTLYSPALAFGSADVAEWVNVSEPVEPGDVLEFDPENPGGYRKARGGCSSLVAGVVSTEPGVVLGELTVGERVLLALVGIVPVKACDEGGAIRPGDLLVTASRSGYVKRCEAEECAFIVGKAMEPLTEGEGLILVLLTR